MDADRLTQQLAFLVEIDKLKGIIRRTHLIGVERFENTAEHSWHLAMGVLVLSEYADEAVDVMHVLQMVLVHDIVEIDAGDTYAYDPAAVALQAEHEQRAAERLFGLLPADQAAHFRALWDEFEAYTSADARFARAIDRLMPLLHNFYTEGRAWQEHGIRRAQVMALQGRIGEISGPLWDYAQGLIDEAVRRGYLAE
ncbi:MAG: HD domain-containing protein [Anaerolineae bacterium]|nr:HD domain-containing protein [Anaerolineae bacterium]